MINSFLAGSDLCPAKERAVPVLAHSINVLVPVTLIVMMLRIGLDVAITETIAYAVVSTVGTAAACPWWAIVLLGIKPTPGNLLGVNGLSVDPHKSLLRAETSDIAFGDSRPSDGVR